MAQLAGSRSQAAADTTPKTCLPSDEVQADGTYKQVLADCSVKLVSADSMTTTITFPNGEVITRWEDPDLLKSITVTNKPDGTKITEEATGQTKTITVETPDGQKAIRYPNGIVSTVYPDGKRVAVDPQGSTTTSFPDGRIVIDYQSDYKGEEFAGLKYKPKQDVLDP